MSNIPMTPAERELHRKFIAALTNAEVIEPLPFDEPIGCPVCGGELAIVQTVKQRRGKLVTAISQEVIVCPRCNGLSKANDADGD